MSPLCIYCAIVSVIAIGWSEFASADELAERFDREYETAAKRLEDFYSQLEILEERQTPERIQAGMKPVAVFYRSNGSQFRLDVDDPDVGTFSIIEAPSLSFRVDKEKGHPAYALREVQRRASPEYRQSMRRNATLPFAPYCIIEQRVLDFMKVPMFERVSIESEVSEGEELVRLHWRIPYKNEEGVSKTKLGWFLFQPSKTWALKEYQLAFDDKPTNGRIRARVKYEGTVAGIPLARSIEQWSEKPDGSSEPLMDSHVVRLNQSPSPGSDFTLAAFNLPNDLGEAVQSRIGRLWMILVGLGGLAFSWLLAIWSRRRGRSTR